MPGIESLYFCPTRLLSQSSCDALIRRSEKVEQGPKRYQDPRNVAWLRLSQRNQPPDELFLWLTHVCRYSLTPQLLRERKHEEYLHAS